MADPGRVQTVVDAAERAAASKDFVTAGRLLREAVQLQEADLGPGHPDLANTLNNLGVVCEMTGEPSEAEACYRRAYAISAAALPPDHPFVVTSRENLTECCKAQGKPVDLPRPPQPVAPVEAREHPPREPAPAERKPPVVSASRAEIAPRFVTAVPFWLALVIAGAITLVLVIIALRGSSNSDDVATATQEPVAAREAPPAAAPPAVATAPDSSATAVPPPRSGSKPERAASRGAASPRSQVVSADVCRKFSPRGSDWQCDSVRGSVGVGTLVFYTRIKSVRATTVEHRWYRGNELHQSVSLDVSANQDSGYRTYSRYTVKTPGKWRVELRTNDGALLHEERFDVR